MLTIWMALGMNGHLYFGGNAQDQESIVTSFFTAFNRRSKLIKSFSPSSLLS